MTQDIDEDKEPSIQESSLDFKKYARRPFVIDAVMITEENIEEVAKFIGTAGVKKDGTPYIQVDPRKVKGLYRAYPGFWLTRVGEHARCYSKRMFARQFGEMTDDIHNIVEYMAFREPDSDQSESGEVVES